MSTMPIRPRLVASRRVDFHMRRSALSRWKYRQVDCFICASEAIRDIVVSDGIPRQRTVTVHEGIDLGRVAAAPPAELHKELWLPHEAPLVGNVAALVPHKGQRHLIDAAMLVLPQHPDARFIIAGEGELRVALEQQVRQHRLEKHVMLAGFRADILSLHKAFDVFVMSSVTEGLGTSLLDARGCGNPRGRTTSAAFRMSFSEPRLLVPPAYGGGPRPRRLSSDARSANAWERRAARVRGFSRDDGEEHAAVYQRRCADRAPAERALRGVRVAVVAFTGDGRY